MSGEEWRRRPVLDHGYVQLVEAWGADERIIGAARMSTGKGFLGWGPKHKRGCDSSATEAAYGIDTTMPRLFCGCGEPGDEKLLRFLWEHGHTSPFEMAGATFEIAAPIFVFREWHRHRTQSYNELSARYTPMPDENYLPSPERCFPTATANKQAQSFSDTKLSRSDVDTWLVQLLKVYKDAQACYEKGLTLGIPKEVARLPVPVGRYSRMRASANLLNWLRFVSKRATADAQWEIRQYAFLVQEELEKVFPRTMEIFGEGGSRV